MFRVMFIVCSTNGTKISIKSTVGSFHHELAVNSPHWDGIENVFLRPCCMTFFSHPRMELIDVISTSAHLS